MRLNEDCILMKYCIGWKLDRLQRKRKRYTNLVTEAPESYKLLKLFNKLSGSVLVSPHWPSGWVGWGQGMGGEEEEQEEVKGREWRKGGD